MVDDSKTHHVIIYRKNVTANHAIWLIKFSYTRSVLCVIRYESYWLT
jgi:hypothetical protein